MKGDKVLAAFIVVVMCILASFVGYRISDCQWEEKVIVDGAYEWSIDSKTGKKSLIPVKGKCDE